MVGYRSGNGWVMGTGRVQVGYRSGTGRVQVG